MAISLDITRKLPIGVQSFEDLRKKDCLYVDKTDYVYFLTHSGTTSFVGTTVIFSTKTAKRFSIL